MEAETLTYNTASLRRMAENFGNRLEIATVTELTEREVIFVEDGNHGENRPRQDEFASTGIAFLRPPDLKEGRVDFQSCGRISDAGFRRVRKGIGRRGDIILTHRATVGRIAITSNDAPEVFVTNPGTTIWRSTDADVLDQRYLYCFMRSAAFMDQLWSQVGNNSTFDYVSLTQQRGLRVAFPPLAEQKAIAAMLGALDAKIELNRRMNVTLEAMARALFQSWFVDFDPVRAKLDGRHPVGLDPATAALFSEHLEDSPLGPIPKGWTAGKLGDIGTNSRRGVKPSDIAPNTPYIALEHMPRRCIALGNWDDSGDVASGKSVFKKGEILFGKLRPYFHKVGVAPFDGVCSTDILVLAPKRPEWFGFLLGHASSDELIQFTDLASTGTKMPRTNWSDISSFKVALPPKPIAVAFTRTIQPMVDRIHANLDQSRTLAILRDTLLPKLLSGELPVDEAAG